MTSQPGGGPAIPAAAAVAGLGADEDRTDEGTGNENEAVFTGAGGQADQTDDGVPVGSADAEQDRIRASDDEGDDDDR